LVLVVGTLMVPAVGMTIDEQTADSGSTDTTTEELQPIFQPVTTVVGASIMLVATGILFSWLGVFG